MHDKGNSRLPSSFPQDLFSLLKMIFVAVSVAGSYFCGGYESRERLRRARKCVTVFSLRVTTVELSTVRHYLFIDSVIDLILLNTYCMTKSAWQHQQTNKKDQKKPRRRYSLCAFSLLSSPAGKQTTIPLLAPHRGPGGLYEAAWNPREESVKFATAEARGKTKGKSVLGRFFLGIGVRRK